MPQIDLSMLNQRQTPAFYADVLANRPAAGFIGRIFVSTNTYAFYRDNGTSWDLIGGPGTGTITGSGANGQVSYWNGASTITGSNDLFFDAVNGHLGIGTVTPGTALDVKHDQSTVVQLEQITATNDIRIAFINSGVGLWRLGAFYNAGANDFGLFDIAAAAQPVTVKRTTGQVLIGTSTVGSGKLVVASATGDNGIQIVGASAPSLRIDNAESGPTKRAGFGISTATNNFIQGSADRDFCMFNGSTTASPILFGIYNTTNVAEAARISAARNFLIGTATDGGFRLSVNGTTNLSNTVTIGPLGISVPGLQITGNDQANTRIRITNSGGSSFSVVTGNPGASNSGFAIYDETNAATRLYISSSGATTGFIGINTTTPFDRFSVGGNILVDAGNNEGFKLNGGLFIYRLSGNDLGIFTNSAERARFTNGGNLLIGTTTDAGQKLQVNGVTQSNSYKSISGTVSIASGATATAYTIPSVTNFDGLYLVQVEVTSGSAIYMASGIITALAGNGQMFLTNLYTGANVVLSVSGMNIQITNAGFGTFTWNYTLLFQSI